MKRQAILVLAIISLLIVMTYPTVSIADFIAYSHSDNSLYRSSGPTLQFSKIGTLDTLGYPATNNGGIVKAPGNLVYMTERFADLLYTVSLDDASIVATVQFDHEMEVNGRGLDISPDGILYGVFNYNQLRTVDPLTGKTTFITNITVFQSDLIESIAFSPEGILYAGTDSGNLYELNLTTGSPTLIANTGIADIDALTFASDGFLYATDALLTVSYLFKIDPLTGITVNLGSMGLTEVNGLLAIGEIEIIPIPGAALLGTIGLGLAGMKLRRLKEL